jgi:uncharacterized protein YneF (UPF0154 family)
MRKRASILDNFIFIVGVLILFLGVIVGYVAYQETDQILQSTAANINDQGLAENINTSRQDHIEFTEQRYSGFWDFLIVFLAFGTFFSIVIVSYILENNPIFTVFYFIGSFVLIFVSIFINNAFYMAVTSGVISQYTGAFPLSMWMLENYLIIEIFFVAAVGVALFTKREQGSTQVGAFG